MNDHPGLAFPPTVTTTLPVVAPVGTGTVIDVALQNAGIAETPLNVTVLVPCADPKLLPLIVISWSTGEELIERLLMTGLVIVKDTPLLAVPFTVTTALTDPFERPDGIVAVIEFPPLLQFETLAATSPNFTVLEPCVDPNPVPLITTEVPDAPDVGLRLVITGAAQRRPLTRRTKPNIAQDLGRRRKAQIIESPYWYPQTDHCGVRQNSD